MLRHEILDFLECCYLDSITKYLEALASLSISDNIKEKKNSIFNLISIFNSIDWDNSTMVEKYVSQINNQCGCSIKYEPKLIIEEDSAEENFEFDWVGHCEECEKYEQYEWIGEDLVCQKTGGCN